MPITPRGLAARIQSRTVLALTLLLSGLALPLDAQTDMDEPWISFSPDVGTFTSATITVTVRFSDNASLNTATRTITFNDTAVTSRFTHTAVTSATHLPATTTSTATLTMKPGVNTLSASIRDNANNLSNPATVTYTFIAGRPEVRVSPDGGTAGIGAWQTIATTFRVGNPGTRTGTYRLRPECRDAWTGAPHSVCAIGYEAVNLAAGDSAFVTVWATGTSPGRVLLVRLSAELESMPGVADAGWADVTVTGSGGGGSPTLQAQQADLATGAYPIQRGQCVTASAGPGAAYECGDLRLAHALPAHRTFNRGWAPVLMYNSQHADPRPSVYLDVTLPEGAEVPGSVSPVLYFSATGAVEQRFFSGSEWQPGTTRRIGVQMAARPTGWYHYYAQVLSTWQNGQPSSPVLASALTVINRSDSPFGAGWWLAGLEQLVPLDGGTASRLLWIGGDGSTRLYQPTPEGQWVWENPWGAPDTMIANTHYVRRLPEGGRVEFTGTGQHVRTINRLGQVTEFQWANGRLVRVLVPTAGGTQPAYDFAYDANGVLEAVSATALGAPTRTVILGHELGGGRVTYIQDPDGKRVNLAYGGTRPNLVTRRTDRRGTQVTFTYSASGRLTSTRLGLANGDSIISGFEPVEDKGFAQSVPLAQAHTALDGPRTDVVDRTLLWTDERGAVRRVRDAMGRETLLTRGDARFPALVTEVRTSNARGDSLVLRSSVGYDARGRITADTVHNPLGDGVHRVTTYGWNNAVDRPDWINAPGAATVYMGYDSITRNPRWQQQGGSQARRVLFEYNANGQVERIRYPHATTGAVGGGGVDQMVYDAAGNLKRTVSPLGFVTLFYRDALGRVTETISPVHAGSSSDSASVATTGMRHTVAYDIMDRDTLSVTYGRPTALNRVSGVARLHATDAEAVTVRTIYDDGGLPLAVERWATPDTAHVDVLTTTYGYDKAGRKTSESDGMVSEQYTYDLGGNLLVHRTRRSHDITMTYDALGRMTRRVTPSVSYPANSVNCGDLHWTGCVFNFPKFSNNDTGGWTIPADTAYFSFDAAGNMVRAQNLDAIVSRTYYPGGALKTDTLALHAYGAGDFSKHVYGVTYRYDPAGRMRALLHPSNLAGAAQRDSFAYNAVTGALETVVGRTNLSFGYGYDLLGRLTSETMPGNVGNTFTYDLDGRRLARSGINGETFTYDARGKVLSASVAGRSVFRNYYSGIGNLVATEWDNDNNAAEEVEEFRLDALGHQVWRRSATNNQLYRDPEYVTRYTMGTSRVNAVQFTFPPPGTFLDSTAFARDTTFRTYDQAGNVLNGWERAWGSSYRKVQTRSYYGADNKLRAQQAYSEQGGMYFTGERRGYFSEYRYDALGRRILVRTRRDGLCNTSQSTVDCTSGIERYVWSGENILWELRGPGGNAETANRLELEYDGGSEYGIVGYTHAGGVDRPLVAYKTAGGYTGAEVVPHMNWRGLFSMGTTASGPTTTVPVEWPGFRTTAYHSKGETQESTTNWMGSLLEGQRDAGGQMYMRNRYYDPATGQFTQSDPIGIAGGLNTYGFANGDPVSYSDPYGLSACPVEAGGDGQTESYDDCPEGSPGWYANRLEQGEGSRLMNTLGGVFSSCGHSTRCIRAAIRVLPGASSAFERIVERSRRWAVARAWDDERALVEATGAGTVEWTAAEQSELLRRGRVAGYDGHHIYNVADNLHLAGNPANIEFVRRGKEHIAKHGGNYHNSTSGPLIDRSY